MNTFLKGAQARMVQSEINIKFLWRGIEP